MVNIKKQQVKAYILLESIMAMALLVVLSSLVLAEVSASRAQVARQNQDIEVLNVGLMAFDSKQSHLRENGVSVTVIKTDKQVVLESSGQEVLRLEILQETP
ncbi:competence type IV pilus minor pilin ComGE [Pseudolactococcus yaeyamensis]